MGWTGTYCSWGNKESNLNIFKRVYDPSLTREIESGKSKICQRGSNIYVLYPIRHGEAHWVVKYLCQRNKKDNEFLTKDIDAITNDCFDFPKAWLDYLPKDSERVAEYLQKRKDYENSKVKVAKIQYNDILECVSNVDIEWNNGYSIKKGDKFFVHVCKHNPFARRTTKDYVITQQTVNYKGEKVWSDDCRRISSRTFKYVTKKVIR